MAERDVIGMVIGKPKPRCCRSRPRWATCPAGRATPQRVVGRASLVEEILRGAAPPVPASVTDALLSLAAARRAR